jgi:16S rRNA (cytidine1402-2'-O)-methyltransferase
MNINDHPGVLYIVATPIGNLNDISARALETLKTADAIAAEDTRHSSALLKYYAIKTPMMALHEYNERESAAFFLEQLQKGKSIALISDAGTPLISDPGYFLVREARRLGIRVSPIPGPCAAITALCAAGMPTDRFIFEGFLPTKTKARVDRLTELAGEPRTLVFYEAPHRILATLTDMKKVFGPHRHATLARELTKLYETIRSAPLAELLDWVTADLHQQRGEIVLVIEGAKGKPLNLPAFDLLTLLLENIPLKKAVELAAQLTGQRKNELYELALTIRSKDNHV